jgi:uncharacterized NAD(P)/FAD-binding protein YdhS
VGAGAAGTLAAVQLTRAARMRGERLRVLLVDDRSHGPGLAYSTGADVHRLNVAAARMSARSDDPDHFLNWYRARGWRCDPAHFARRSRYGLYLRDQLAEACTKASGEVELVPLLARAVALRGRSLELGRGRPVDCDAVVLALGNFPPPSLAGVPQHHRVIEDPWDPISFSRIARPDRIVLVGTGLTMVDVALVLAERFPDVPLDAVSRSGLVPFAHLPCLRTPAAPAIVPDGPLGLDDAVRTVGDALTAAGRDWRSVIDGLRPQVQRIWRALTIEDQRRFLRDHAREWEVRRHRIAPPVAAGVKRLRAGGHLNVRAGSLATVEPRPGRLVVTFEDGSRTEASYLVNCTGPQQDLRDVDDPFVRDLMLSRTVMPHPLGLGLEVDAAGAAAGMSEIPVMTIGSLRRGALYETTSIPEIREQARAVADELVPSGRLARGLDVVAVR